MLLWPMPCVCATANIGHGVAGTEDGLVLTHQILWTIKRAKALAVANGTHTCAWVMPVRCPSLSSRPPGFNITVAKELESRLRKA